MDDSACTVADSKSFKWTERVVEGKVEQVVAPVVPDLPGWTKTRVVGQPVEREDARLKVTGGCLDRSP